MKKVTINKNDAAQRLDKFITKYMPRLPQGMLYKGLRKNCVRVNGKHVKDGKFVLSEGDELTLYFADEFFDGESSFTKGRSDIDVVYEDENIILINKPAGIVVHADDKGTSDTLLGRMQSYLYEKGEYDQKNEHSFSPAFANRLDRGTSGIIIGAKNSEALRVLNEKIKSREIKKYYLAICEGVTDKSGTLTAFLTRGDKIVTVKDRATDGAKEIRTKYKTLAVRGDYSLIEVELLTGRTHQIRAQMAHIGHPLAGDRKYGAKTGKKMQLASYKLRFDFSTDGGVLNYMAGMEFTSEPDFSKAFLTAKS